jgi:hypothetical protein
MAKIKLVFDWFHANRMAFSWFLIGGLLQQTMHKASAGDASWWVELVILAVVFATRKY